MQDEEEIEICSGGEVSRGNGSERWSTLRFDASSLTWDSAKVSALILLSKFWTHRHVPWHNRENFPSFLLSFPRLRNRFAGLPNGVIKSLCFALLRTHSLSKPSQPLSLKLVEAFTLRSIICFSSKSHECNESINGLFWRLWKHGRSDLIYCRRRANFIFFVFIAFLSLIVSLNGKRRALILI